MHPRGRRALQRSIGGAIPGRWQTPEDWPFAYHNNYTTSPFPREGYQGLDTYIMGTCHLLWP